MEARKITVVQTKNQKKSVIMSAATTLAELKSDLRANDIDYNGMTFFEGISKVELKNDASVLPHDVPYKGIVTNELVFMLTNTNKKIRSGAMSRMEAYAEIKRRGLQDACLKKFGKNFTMCKTADLIALVQSNGASKPAPVAPASNGGECVDTVARAAISKLVEILEDNGTIEYYEKDEVLDILGGAVEVAPSEEYKPKSASPYSDNEINDMFEGMGIH
uniref:hypothetical protein n=1 Tax=Lachnospira eligens TaxID=39485 RepID=UPI0040268387